LPFPFGGYIVSNIRYEIEQLYKERKKWMSVVSQVTKEIRALQEKCPHESLEKGDEFPLDQHEDDLRENGKIIVRRNKCWECGHSWMEQKHEDDELFPYDRERADKECK
jgi:hypothetical protein